MPKEVKYPVPLLCSLVSASIHHIFAVFLLQPHSTYSTWEDLAGPVFYLNIT